jgi:hypothetical protein
LAWNTPNGAILDISRSNGKSAFGDRVEVVGSHDGRHAVQHADINVLPDAGVLALVQRRQNADDAVERGEHIRDRHAYADRWAVREPCGAHETAHRLDDRIHGLQIAVRAVLTETADRAIDH